MNKYILFTLTPLLFLLLSALDSDEIHDDSPIPQKVIDYCESEDGMFDDSCMLLMDNEHTIEDDEFIYEIMTGTPLHIDHIHDDAEQILEPLLEQQIENEMIQIRGFDLLEQTKITRGILNELESDEFRKFQREQRTAPQKKE